MFGLFRFILAMMVVVTHIGGIEIVAGIAVWGFFMLSGFLMTGVLNSKYGFQLAGLKRFAFSRSVRLFPTYWLSVLITAVVLVIFGADFPATLINSSLQLPSDIADVFSNIFIVGHTVFGIGRSETALSPSVWAVDVEILMYVCSCIFLARSPSLAKWTSLLLLVTFPLLWVASKYALREGDSELANQLIYSFLPAALLPYSLGGWLWFSRDKLHKALSSSALCVASVLGLILCIFVVSRVSVTGSYVLSLIPLGVIILYLSKKRQGLIPRWADEFFGRMSYPIYLLHWLCAYLVVLLVPSNEVLYTVAAGRLEFSFLGFLAVSVTIILVSAFFAIYVEKPIEKIRHSFNKRNAGRSATEGLNSESSVHKHNVNPG
ncbi:MAG: acyltransferase [Agarilytica sp.]